MSNFMLSACWPLPLPPTQKLVLVSLADQANDEGVCWLSSASLVRRTGLSERAVRNALRALEDAGLLRTNHRDGTTNWYTLTPAAGAALQHVPPTPALRAAPPAPDAAPPRHQVPPNHKGNHQVTTNNPKATRQRAAQVVELPEWLPADAWAAFVDHRRKIKAPLTDRAAVLAMAELDKLRAAGHDPRAIIDQSILNGWRGLFAPKESMHAARSSNRRESEAERVERINRAHDERERAAGLF